MDHLKLIKQYFDKHFPSFKGTNGFINAFEIKVYPKKELLLRYGKVEKELKFINKGIVREYYMTDGNEVNIDFYSEGHFLTNFISFHTDSPSSKYQECITETELLVLSKKDCDEWLKKYPEGNILIETSFKRVLLANEKKELELITHKPEVIYKALEKAHPNWLLNIPQYHIASYLRITPETLSRIRKRNS